MEFGKLDIVKIADFFSKIDMTKICRLKMMIRKITHIRTADRKTGRPQELAFYMQANQLAPEADIPIQTPADPDPTPHNNINISTNDPPIKICEEDDPPLGKEGTQPAASQANLQAAKGRTVAAINKELQILGICKDRNPDEPLTYREIMNGYDGFFIGRLLRLKHTNK
uniref:Predicted protein n=1 Tax=Hordeum vulgare subsp. vulgare TaxID=112509 RepID=F2DTL5_HORVV|nr:predicted protein [Hordeum vulgare subsp. vulgare]